MSWSRISTGRRWRRGIFGLLAVLIATATGTAFAAPKPDKKPTPTPAVKPPVVLRPPATDDLYEGPASAGAAKTAAPRPGAENHLVAPLSPGPKYADAWASEKRKSEPDLQLTREGENRALAIAAFAEGQAADERGDPDKAIEAWKRAADKCTLSERCIPLECHSEEYPIARAKRPPVSRRPPDTSPR